jgi:hypothetical protein
MKEYNEIDELFDFLIEWAKKNNFSIVVPSDEEIDKDIDFININLKTKTVYADELNIIEPLTEVG